MGSRWTLNLITFKIRIGTEIFLETALIAILFVSTFQSIKIGHLVSTRKDVDCIKRVVEATTCVLLAALRLTGCATVRDVVKIEDSVIASTTSDGKQRWTRVVTSIGCTTRALAFLITTTR
jgi:hypothetical protein